MAHSMRCSSSKTSCPRSRSERRAGAVLGIAPFTASSRAAAPLNQQQQISQHPRRQQLDSRIVRVAAGTEQAAGQAATAQKVRCCGARGLA
jgi:hypothetical protein